MNLQAARVLFLFVAALAVLTVCGLALLGQAMN